MNMIPNETIKQIQQSVDIVDIISKELPLENRGKNLFGVCPFHDDHSPSMCVSREKQIYTCWSCGATGNVFKFLQDYKNISFLEAVKECADTAGIDIKINNYKEITKNNELYEMYDLATKLYQNNINTKEGITAKKYLNDRQISDEIIKTFKIGLALNDSKLSKTLIKKNYKEKDLLKSGLVVKRDFNYYDFYYDRIMIPIEDSSGKVVAFSGRLYNKEKTKSIGKYINSAESEIFKKSEILFNYKKAQEEARQKNTIIIMEGPMDLFRAYSIGVKNVVVSLGTAFTKEHALLLKKLAKNVILCFDGDEAGSKATNSCSDQLIKLGIIPKIVRLEDNLDPDEYILKYGKEKFIEKINNPISVMDFKLNYLKNKKDLNSSHDMSLYVNEMIKELNNINDDIEREITLKKISEQSNLDIDFLREKLEKKEEKPIKIVENKPKIIKNINMYIKAEQYLLYYMLNNDNVVKLYKKNIGYMPTDKYRKLAFEISQFYKKYKYISISELMIELRDDEELMNTINEIITLNLKDEYTDEQINDYIKTIKNYNIKIESNRLKDLMRMEIDPIKKAEYAEKILEIQKTNIEVGE